MQAIVVQFLGPANARGARLKATAQAGSMTVSYDHSGMDREARVLAKELCAKFNWEPNKLVGGHLPSGDRVFVMVYDSQEDD